MPTAAPKPCACCGVLVRDGTSRCVEHKVKPGSFADSRRGSRHERGYGARWDKLRAQVLRRDAGICQCETCQSTGAVRVATQVDHRINKAEWRRLHGSLAGVDALTNLRAINADCHRAKTQAEAQASRRHGGYQKSDAPSPGTGRVANFLRARVIGVGGVS